MSDEKLIAKHMRSLGCTREEAIQLIQDDRDIDKGLPKPWDLTKEQLKNARKLANVSTRRNRSNTARAKKENPMKQAIISAITSALTDCEGISSVQITNTERTVDFKGTDGVAYTVTLTAHRQK